MNNIFSIAIDGPAGAGKSTVARRVAEELGAVYLDTGAMYRTMGLYMQRNGISDPEAVAAACTVPDIDVAFKPDGQHMLLGGEDVTGLIRTSEAGLLASSVAKCPAVRTRLVDLQRSLAARQSMVMDGRDIGTHVLTSATLKVFLTATAEERARRRCMELTGSASGPEYAQILQDIRDRDYADSHRAASPMRQAEDAVLLDCSELTVDEVVSAIVSMLRERL